MAKSLVLCCISAFISIICFSYLPKVGGQNYPPPPRPAPSFGAPPPHSGPPGEAVQGFHAHFDFGNGYQDVYANEHQHGAYDERSFGGNGGLQGGSQSGVGVPNQGSRNFESRNTYTQQGGPVTSGGHDSRSGRNNQRPVYPSGGNTQYEQQNGSDQQQGTFESRRNFSGGNGYSQGGGYRTSSGGSRGSQGGSGSVYRQPRVSADSSGGNRGSQDGARGVSRTQGGFADSSRGNGGYQVGSGSTVRQQGGFVDSTGGRGGTQGGEGRIDNQGRSAGKTRSQSGTGNEFERGRVFSSASGNQRSHNDGRISSQNRFVGLTGTNVTDGSRSEFRGSFGLSK